MDLTGAQWKTSSRSSASGGECVEVASNLPGIVAVRDSKNPNGGSLTFAPGAWAAFLSSIKSGEIDV